MLLQLIDVPGPSLVSDKHVHMCISFSRCLQALVHKTITVMPCSLLFKQLLPDIYQAAGNFCFQRTLRAQEHWAAVTRNFTLDVASQQTRPPFRRLRIIQNHSRMRLAETARDVKHCWWVVVINRITSFINRRTYYFSQGRVETPIRRGWHFVKVLLQIYYSICVPKIIKKYNAVW